MSDASKKIEAQQREMPEPWEGNRPVPWVVITIVAGLFLWSVGYIWSTYQGVPSEYGDWRSAADFAQASAGADGGSIDGGKLYAANCVACHQASGDGVAGVFPPLGGSEWVVGQPEVLVQILLHGVTGELTVKGTTYKGEMPAFAKLDDGELAALATYIRTEFGNEADAVGAELVAAQRAAIDRDQPWQGDEELASLVDGQ